MNINNRLSINPYFTSGPVVKGFGRGSKKLGIPTANFPDTVINALPQEFETGVYYGWARVNNGDIHKAVLSIGYNPFFKNEVKSLETHIIHEFDKDFYDAWLRISICGYIRSQENYNSVDDLIKAIRNDIKEATENLDKPIFTAARESEDLVKHIDTLVDSYG